jgi:RimJ/RimL family protein N-acetyltransferase
VTPIELAAGLFTLRAPKPADAAWVYDACQDPLIARWTRAPFPYRPADAVAFVHGAATGWSGGTEFRFVIELTDTGELLGACGLTRDAGAEPSASVPDAPDAEVGFWLAADGRGRGAATAAVAALVDWAPRVAVSRLNATVKVGNIASEAVLTRCEFVMTEASWSCFTPGGAVPAHRWQRSVG